MANAIITAAESFDADAIVMGTRGPGGGVPSILLGSVSDAVVHHAGRAVLVVPAAATEERRDPGRSASTRAAQHANSRGARSVNVHAAPSACPRRIDRVGPGAVSSEPAPGLS